MSIHERDLSILLHMVHYCEQIDEAINRFGDAENTFTLDKVYQNAVAMCLLQIGELAGRLSDEYRATHSAIPWRQIRALRNLIAHDYGSVDAETAWEIVKGDLPKLRRYCEDEIKAQPDS